MVAEILTVVWRFLKVTQKVSVPDEVPRLVAINGYGTVGKDSVGDILHSHYGAVRLAFADALISIAAITATGQSSLQT